MSANTKPVKFTDEEKKYIMQEAKALFIARQQPLDVEALVEWIKSFRDLGYNAEHICRLLRLAKYYISKANITFADIHSLTDRLGEVEQIIPVKYIPKETTKEEDGNELVYRIMKQAKDTGLGFVLYVTLASDLNIKIDTVEEADIFYKFVKSLKIKSKNYDSIIHIARQTLAKHRSENPEKL